MGKLNACEIVGMKLSTFILEQEYDTLILIYQNNILTDTILTDEEEMYTIRKEIRDKEIKDWGWHIIYLYNNPNGHIKCIKVQV